MSRKKLTESIIRAGAEEKSFERGEALYREDAISNTYVLGNVVTGDCAGTQAPFYRVRVELDDAGIRSASCTCAYDYGGYCKHVVALLLTYVHHPKQFAVRQAVSDLLANLSQEDLLALLGRLVGEHPDLYDWVEYAVSAPSPNKGAKRARHKKVDDQVYRRQVRDILHSLDGMRASEAYWHVDSMADELAKVRDAALQFLEAGDPNSALAILLALIEEAHHGIEYIDDSDGFFGDFMIGLGQPLAEVILSLDLSALERERLAATLEKLDGQMDDYGISGLDVAIQAARYGWEDAPAHQSAPPRPGARLPAVVLENDEDDEYDEDDDEDWDAPDDEDEWMGAGSAGPEPDLVEAKLNVLQRQGRMDEYLALCQKHGRHLRYALKLCDLQRAPETVLYARQNFTLSDDALALGQRLREMRRVSDAIDVGEHGLTLVGLKAQLGEWLGPIEEAQGRTQQALQAWQAAFPEDPTLEHYKILKRLAGAGWAKLRPSLMKALRKSYDRTVLAEVLLFEEEWDEAVKVAEKRDVYGGRGALAVVADGVIAQRPEWVIRACTKQAESLIALVQSNLYDEVAEWLKRVKKAYAQVGQVHVWQAYLQRLKDDYKRRPSLQARLKNL